MSELPHTTTTGDPRKDVRSKGDGAVDAPGDALHHAEDAQLFAGFGFVTAWKARLARRRDRSRR